jgi:hypothetical protein
MRETAFRVARKDLASFLDDHEEELLRVFREEIQKLDDEIPEENLFIDIHMVPLGETVMKAVLRAVRRFLLEDFHAEEVAELAAGVEALEESATEVVE